VSGVRDDLETLLTDVQRGVVGLEAALEQLAQLPFRDLAFARPDVHRELRQGAPEAVLAEGKTPWQVVEIAAAMLEAGAGSVLVTRADAEVRRAICEAIPHAQEDELARLAWVARAAPERRGLVTIVSAGTSDGPVVHAARVRAELLGAEVSCMRMSASRGFTGSSLRSRISGARIA
jgi:pyridinium-3,5-biscarboxylic acid mononucleotide synthase